MSEWVAIAGDETEEPVEVPTETDGTVNLASVTAQFPGATGLKYRHPETNKLRGIRIQGDVLYPPSEEGWGPYTFLCVRARIDSPKKDESGLKRKTDNDGEMYSKNIRYDEDEDDPNEPCDLIVLGLPYKATQEEISEFFEQFGAVDMVLLKTKPSGESRGFAFIRFKDKAVEKKVTMQRHMIGGRLCDIKVPDSQMSKEAPTNENNVRSACKIFVGKITEDLTVQDLREHFEEFGTVKDVYIPQPFRSFAFVQFSESKPAKLLRGKEHEIKGVSVRIGQAVPKSDTPQQQAPGYGGYGGGGGGYGGAGGGYGASGYGAGYGGGGGYGGGYQAGAPYSGHSGFGGPFDGASGYNAGGGGSYVGGAFAGGAFGGGGRGGRGGQRGGGGGGPPGGINFADFARWAMEMGNQYQSQAGPANNWSHGGNRGGGGGGDGRGGAQNMAHFAARRSQERRF